jgi:hypothetical protein
MAMSAGREAASGMEKGGDDASWANVDLNGPKMKKTHAVDSATINGR